MQPRILIVEDEGLIAKDIATTVERIGYEVVGIVARGEEAVKVALERRPDIILMDIHLKGPTDGIQAAQEILANAEVPIVFLTAHSDEATLGRAKLAGPHGYIVKPFEEVDLRTTLEIALHNHAADLRVRRAEELLRAILGELREAVAGVDEGGNVMFFNAAAEGMTGCPAAEASGRPTDAVIHLSMNETDLDVVLDAARRKAEHRSFDATLHARDGSQRPVRGVVTPLTSRPGTAILILRDAIDQDHYDSLIRERDLKIAALERRVRHLV